MTPLLDVRGLRGGYGRVEVLRGVDLCVNRGEIVALLGSNGAGKSTLNNAVCGIHPAWGGTVQFNEVDLTRAHYRVIVKAGLIQVPEGRRVFPNLTVRENLELGSFTRARERRAQNVERVFAIQAGREVRVVVTPEHVDDTRMTALSEEIARRIESELQYPGQIKVVVIRESRAVDFAR